MRPYDMIIMEMIPGDTPREKYENLKKLGDIIFQAGWIPGWTKKDITQMIQNKFTSEEIKKLSGEK